jgi:hypothetical protein
MKGEEGGAKVVGKEEPGVVQEAHQPRRYPYLPRPHLMLLVLSSVFELS